MFVYIAAHHEAHAVQMKSLMNGVPVRTAMLTSFSTLKESDTFKQAVSLLLAGDQQYFSMPADGQLVGVLNRSDLVAALAAGRVDERVADVMRLDCRTVDEHEMLGTTFVWMQEGSCVVLPIVRGNRVVEIVNPENVGEWMMIQSALRGAMARSEVDNVCNQS